MVALLFTCCPLSTLLATLSRQTNASHLRPRPVSLGWGTITTSTASITSPTVVVPQSDGVSCHALVSSPRCIPEKLSRGVPCGCLPFSFFFLFLLSGAAPSALRASRAPGTGRRKRETADVRAETGSPGTAFGATGALAPLQLQQRRARNSRSRPVSDLRDHLLPLRQT